MTHRDQEGRRDHPTARSREHEHERQDFRYGRGRSDYEDRPEYSARVQRQSRGYEADEGEYYGARQFSERGQSPAWMEESRNWDYEGGPERFGSSGYEEGQQQRWQRELERQRSSGAGSQREQSYAARPGSYYGERQHYAARPDLGYGTHPRHPRATHSSGHGPFTSSRGYEIDYGTRSVYGGESAGYGGRGSLYSRETMSEDRMMDRDDLWASSARYSEPTRAAVARGYSSMGLGYRGVGPKNYRRSDERLTEEINERLTEDDSLDASEISVRVADGKVTLEGTVDQRWMKHLAEDIADACSGVKEVDNRITVTAGSDQLIRGTRTSRTATPSTTTSGTTGPTGTMPH